MSNENRSENSPVKMTQKLSYAAGNIGSGLLGGIFGVAMVKFYSDIIGLSASSIATAYMIYAIWNAINDPIFGFLSDHVKWKGKNGHRIPWIRLMNPFLAAFFVALWWAPIGDSWIQFFYLFSGLILYDTAYTIVVLNSSALLADMHESTVERSRIQLVSGILGGLAGIVAVVIPSLLLTSSVDLVQYREIMLLFAIGCLILMEIQAYRVKIRFIAEPDQPMGLKDSVKEALRNKSFITLVACNFTMIFMSSVAGSGLNYFTEYALGVSGVGLVIPIIFILLGLISGAIALMRWVKTIGLKPAMIRGLLLSGIGLILIPFMPGWSIYIPLAFVGFGLIIPALSFNVFIGDLADEDELKTSNRREGMFFGVNALITKPAQSIAAAFIVYMLEFYQYVKPIEITPGIFESQVQSPYTIFGIKIMFGLIPGIALLIGAWIFSYYGLTKERSEQVKLELSKRNAEKRTF